MDFKKHVKLGIMPGIVALTVITMLFSGCGKDDEPVNVEELLQNSLTGFENSSDFDVVGNVQPYNSVYGTAGYNFTQGSDLPGCAEEPSSYIQVDSLGPIWQDGFSVAAFVQFTEPRFFERIIDFGNGPGDTGGLNVTMSRLRLSNDLAFTSWINSDSTLNRTQGRIVAREVIKDGVMMFVVGTISPSGVMTIYIDGVEINKKVNGHPVMNVPRTHNFIGRSNWCLRDPDFKGKMDGLFIFNKELSKREADALYDYFLAQ